jgi:hypothetical protein
MNVLDFTKAPAFVLGLGLLTGGCAGPQVSGGVAGREAGTTTLRVENQVSAPQALEGVTVAVDGEPVSLTTVPPPGGGPAIMGSLRLAPGPHTIAVRARARVPGAEPGGALIVVGAQQPFLVERKAAAITIAVRSASGSPPEGAAPLAVSLSILGGRTAPEIGAAPPDGKDERCAALQPIPRALCRAAVDLDEATRRNDVAAAYCVRDKIAEMHRLAIVGETGQGEGLALAEAQVGMLAQLVDRCGGEAVVAPRPDGLTVIRPGTR